MSYIEVLREDAENPGNRAVVCYWSVSDRYMSCEISLEELTVDSVRIEYV